MPAVTGELATRQRFFGMPESWVGWLSPALMILGGLEIFVRRPFGFRGVFATLTAAGAIALVAVLWRKERSFLVWIPLVVGAVAAVVVGAEFVSPH